MSMWLWLVFGVTWASGEAEEAEITFQLGTAAFTSGDYDRALAAFLASHRLAPNASVAFNIAKCYARTGRYAEAYRWFTVARENLTAARVLRAVDDELASITPQVVVYSLVSEPPGATVYVDRKDLGAIGVTPLRLALTARTQPRLFVFENDGYAEAVVDGVLGNRGEEVVVSATLRQIVGSVSFDAPPGTRVHQGAPEGPVLCEAPCSATLRPGTWVLYFRKDGYRDAIRQLDLAADASTTVQIDLQPNTGSLVVDATERGSLVEIDGESVGFTPTVVQAVAVGERVVRVSRPGYEPVERQIVVEADRQTVLDGVQLLPLDEVTAVSRRAEQVELAPSSVTILSGEEIRAFGYPTVYEALRGVRGVSLTYDSIYGAAAFRGLGQANDFGNRLLLLSDGATLNDNILYQSFIGYDGRVDLAGIDRIEVVRGPGSVLYGTGAVSGVVNLVGESRDAPEGVEFEVGTADNHVIRGHAQAHYELSDAVAFRATVAGGASQGRAEVIDPLGPSNPPIEVQGFDRFEGATTTGRLWLPDTTVQWYHSWRTIYIPTGVYDTVLNSASNNYWIDTRSKVEARYEPQLTETFGLLTRAWADRYEYDGVLPYGDYTSVERYLGVSLGAEVRGVWEPGPALRLTTGVQGETSPVITLDGEDQANDGTVTPYLEESSPYSVAAAYALADLVPVDSVRVTAGARVDYWSTFGIAISPRLAFVLIPDDGDTVKLLAGRAFRAPSIYELYYNIPGVQTRPADGTLLPETVWSGEAEYSHSFDEVWTGLVAAHGSLADQLVETVADPANAGAVTYLNSDEPIRIFGGDVELRRLLQGGWMLSTFYSWLDSRYATSGERVPNAPAHNAGFKIVMPISAPIARLAFRSSLEAPRRIDLARDESTGFALISDLVLSGNVPERNFDYAFGVYNLFDMGYAQPLTDTFPMRTMPQQGRSLYASLGLRF